MVLADKAVNEARQLAVQDTVIFADVEFLVQAMRMQPQQQALDPAAREALARMTDALTSMWAMQQAQQPSPNADNTDDADNHAGNGAFPRAAGHAGSCAARSHATSGEHCSWTKPARLEDALEGRKRLAAEELREGLENDLGEKWTEIDEELRSRVVQAVNDRFAPCWWVGLGSWMEVAELKCEASTDGRS